MSIDQLRPVDAKLSFHHSIPRGMVHRAAISEVFLTDSCVDGGSVVIAAQLPRNHAYFSDHRGTSTSYDSLLLVEVFRQVAIYYAHEYLGVATDQKFIFGSAEFSIVDPQPLKVQFSPGHCVVRAQVTDEKRRSGQLVGITLDMTAWIDGTYAAREIMAYQWMPPGAWGKIRQRDRRVQGLPAKPASPGPSLRTRLRPESVGRTNPRNSILAEPCHEDGCFTALTLIDADHPSLFDHALDHVPGMLQFEACRQAAMACAHASLGLDTSRMLMTDFRLTFLRFGEFEVDTMAQALNVVERDDHRFDVTVSLLQNCQAICEGTVTLQLCELDVRTMFL